MRALQLITVFAVLLVTGVAVALLGLRRAGRPEKYGFSLVWGVVLLVTGVFGALYIGISSLNGLAGLVCGAAARRGLQFKKKRGTQP